MKTIPIREVEQRRGLVGAGLRQIHMGESSEKLGHRFDAPKLRRRSWCLSCSLCRRPPVEEPRRFAIVKQLEGCSRRLIACQGEKTSSLTSLALSILFLAPFVWKLSTIQAMTV